MNRAKRTNHSLSLREMAASGIFWSYRSSNSMLQSRRSVNENMIFDLPDGFGCASSIRHRKQSRVAVSGCSRLGRIGNFEWLSDPRELGEDLFNYRFPGKNAPEMPLSTC